MPKGKELIDYEKGEIDGLRKSGKTPYQIAALIKRSRKVVNNYIKLGPNYGKKKRSGRKSTFSCRDFNHILRLSSTGKYSAAKIRSELRLPQHRTTITRLLNKPKYMKYQKKHRTFKLTKEHIKARLKFAQEHMSWTNEWFQVVFSDEEKFNLDGPDGLQYYWHDLRKEPQWFTKRNAGGGSVMCWAACSANGKSRLVFLSGRMNRWRYIELLENELLPIGSSLGGKKWIFQQDNASIHSAYDTLDWLKANKVEVLDWPANSPDLNITENVWGKLVRDVYENGRQFSSIQDLKEQILRSWEKLMTKDLQVLVKSMPHRIYKLILNKGKKINY
jgi:hypothetical protein